MKTYIVRLERPKTGSELSVFVPITGVIETNRVPKLYLNCILEAQGFFRQGWSVLEIAPVGINL